MEVEHSTVKAKAQYELRQLQELVTQWVTLVGTEKKEMSEKTESLIRERLEKVQKLMDSLRQLSNDAEAKQILSELDNLRNHFEKIARQEEPLPKLVMSKYKSVQNETIGKEINDVTDEIPKRRPKRIVDDFLHSLIPTLFVCILFVILWTQYTKTH